MALCNPLQTIIVGLLKCSATARTTEQQTMTRLDFILKYSVLELRCNPTINQVSLKAYNDFLKNKKPGNNNKEVFRRLGGGGNDILSNPTELFIILIIFVVSSL